MASTYQSKHALFLLVLLEDQKGNMNYFKKLLFNLYVSSFRDVSEEGGVVLLDEEGGEEAWAQAVPAVGMIYAGHLGWEIIMTIMMTMMWLRN